jgi:hypothetical protein
LQSNVKKIFLVKEYLALCSKEICVGYNFTLIKFLIMYLLRVKEFFQNLTGKTNISN